MFAYLEIYELLLREGIVVEKMEHATFGLIWDLIFATIACALHIDQQCKCPIVSSKNHYSGWINSSMKPIKVMSFS